MSKTFLTVQVVFRSGTGMMIKNVAGVNLAYSQDDPENMDKRGEPVMLECLQINEFDGSKKTFAFPIRSMNFYMIEAERQEEESKEEASGE